MLRKFRMVFIISVLISPFYHRRTVMMKSPPILMLSCVIAWSLLAPACGLSQDLPVMECASSPASLPLAIEGVAYNASILTSTSPALGGMSASNLPPGLALVDRYVRGTPTGPGTFSVTLKKYYRNGCGKPLVSKPSSESPGTNMSIETITLKVRDSHPPVISSFAVAPETLGSSGGSVTLTVQASDNSGVARILMTTRHPDGHSGSAMIPLTGGTALNGTWSITFALGGNSTNVPVNYAFTVSASDADGNTSNAGPKTIVVAARTALPLKPSLLPH
jgi:hypothetical protein